ncbi:hypothetical protein C817_03076 [Dorea sp. 5-2]|nr:hypothetical protein C817_03076 [Dorea sp. 5-2]
MNNITVYKLFSQMEEKYDMLSSEFLHSDIWKFIRTEVIRILLEHQQNMCVTMTETINKSIKKETLFHKYNVNPYKAGKRDILMIGLGRRYWNGLFYEDPLLDPLCDKLPYSYYIYEYAYREHLEPTKNKKVKYLDRFNQLINTDERKKKARELNDYFIHIIEEEMQFCWTNDEKERLCRYIFFLVGTLDTNFRLFADTILKKVNPKVVIMVNAPDMMNMIIIQEAKKRHIPVVELAHGTMDNEGIAYNFYKRIDLDTAPDYILVFGEYDRKIANYSISKENVIPVGYPVLEEKKKTIQREKDERIRITFFAGANTLLGSYVKFLAENLDEKKYKITFKLHPHQYNSWRKLYPGLEGLSNLEIVDNNLSDAYYYIINCDYVIGIITSILYEATYFNKKIGIIKTDDNGFSENLYLNNHAKLIEDEEQLLDFVKGLDDFVPSRGEYFKENAVHNINLVIHKIIEGQKR